ncbi:MAG: hypothetical protein WCG83_03845 [Candidatus Peregrinibacteria bacterium]
MLNICRNSWCKQPFDITPVDLAFYDKVSPIFSGKKAQIPSPTLCPDCRKQRRLIQANMYSLWKRKCDLTGKEMMSRYPTETPFPVYHATVWWSDAWNPLSYGRDFDFSRPFFQQFQELRSVVPQANITTTYDTLENSEYINYASYLKNCYLVFHTSFCEDCMYSVGIKRSKNLVDCLYTYDSERCYECTNCWNCYDVRFSENSRNCNNSWFLRGCMGCSECAFCTNLVNKNNCFMNKQYSKEEYEKIMKRYPTGSYQTLESMREKGLEFFRNSFVRATEGHQNEDTSGDQLYFCQNVHDSFHVEQARDCRFCERFYTNCEDSYDVDQYGQNAALLYECECCGADLYALTFCAKVRNSSSRSSYCDHCFGIRDCFGCEGLRGKQFCILNKQYTEEEYGRLASKIAGHMMATKEWGEFFPFELSLFGYNETIAQEYFPLTEQEVEKRGWSWREHTEETLKVQRLIPASKLPDSISEIPDDIINWAVECEDTKRPFRITKQELEFYRSVPLPIPRIHPDERRRRRSIACNPSKLWNRPCGKCGKEMETTYAPERPEVVYCEECYLKEVY